ncbi:MAG TPA: response regulator transcription factor [Bacteroidales bacterium]|nr:response regulator transcription factor [Bacteroidales bacterium]
MIKILLAEDDNNLGSLLCDYLKAKNYDTILASDGEEAWALFKADQFDLCILDVMMPRMDGITLARKIRDKNVDVPIIFLTAKSLEKDVIEGFTAGADDYITKPFSMEELLYRIEAIIRRTRTAVNEVKDKYDLGKYTFYPITQILLFDKTPRKLTTKESELLIILCQHMNEVLERNFALKSIWIDDNYFNARSMDVYITKLRKYLKEDPSVSILNVHGKGYKLICK